MRKSICGLVIVGVLAVGCGLFNAEPNGWRPTFVQLLTITQAAAYLINRDPADLAAIEARYKITGLQAAVEQLLEASRVLYPLIRDLQAAMLATPVDASPATQELKAAVFPTPREVTKECVCPVKP